MKFRLFVLMLIVTTVGNVFGMDYSNEEYGIHFVLPDHWKIVDFDDLTPMTQKGLDNMYHPFKTLAIGGLKDQDSLILSQIIIQFRKFERSNFDKAKRYIRTDDAKEMMTTSVKLNVTDVIRREIKQYQLIEAKSDFIKASNRLYGVVRYESNNEPPIIGVGFKLLCKDGWVNLRCFSRGSEAAGFVDTVNKIADSFQYDGSSTVMKNEMSEEEVGRLSREQIFNNIWKWAGIILTISIVLGILKMLFFRD